MRPKRGSSSLENESCNDSRKLRQVFGLYPHSELGRFSRVDVQSG